eukprot:106949_1
MAPSCVSSCISFLVILYISCNSQIQPTSNTTDTDYYIASEISGNISNTANTAFQDSSIYCKKSRDCHIVCDTPNSCKDTTIYCYHDLCNITCSAENSCFNTIITYHPDKGPVRVESDQITLTCNSNENQTPSQAICSSLSFQYTSVSNLNIYANHKYAIYNSTFSVNEAYNIKLIAYGALAYSANTLYGQAVSQSIDIKCVSDTDSACYESDWYIPTPTIDCGDAGSCRSTKKYTYINCYGKGCKDMGNIFISAADIYTNTEWKTNGCGQCESIGECIGSLTLQCQLGKSSTTNVDSFGGCDSTYCSCRYWLKKYMNTSFDNDPSDQNCYAPIEGESEGNSKNMFALSFMVYIVIGVAVVYMQ